MAQLGEEMEALMYRERRMISERSLRKIRD